MGNKIYIEADQIDTVCCESFCQETSINWLRSDTELTICSSDNTFITKMRRLMERSNGAIKCYIYDNNKDKETGRQYCYFFECSKKLLSIRTKLKESKERTPEEKFEFAKRLHPDKFKNYTLEQYIEEYMEVDDEEE